MSGDDRGDRRRSPRSELVLKVEYDRAHGLPSDYLTDLGEDGLFICTAEPFEIGQTLAFALSFPGLLDPLPLKGVVRWRSGPDEQHPDAPQGVGVQFAYVDAEQRRRVAELHARLSPAGPPPAPPDKPFRVLLVEDNEFAHKLFHHAVKRFHCEWSAGGPLQIIGAKDGLEAATRLAEAPIDLAIIDFFLPIMTGGELIRRMRQDPRSAHTPILVISVGGDGVRDESLAAGADLYLDKPVLLKQLLTTLQLLLGRRTPAQDLAPEERYS